MIRYRKPSQRVISSLLERATLFSTLAQLFTEPTTEQIDRINDSLAGLTQSMCRHTTPLAKSFAYATEAWVTTDPHTIQTEYHRLFNGSIPLTLCETTYNSHQSSQSLLNELYKHYHQNGYALSAREGEVPDSLLTELEFTSMLLVKAAFAMSEGDTEHYQFYLNTLAEFVCQHLGGWIPGLTQIMQIARAKSPYAETLVLLDYVVTEECEKLEIQPVPFTHRMPAGIHRSPTHAEPVV